MTMTAFDLNSYLLDRRKRVDEALLHALPDTKDDPGRLKEGMRYAVLQGGKRMRPMVVIAACEAAGGSVDAALPACCALEMVHAYSLVHDDLPAMDNDVERRGKPTVHVAFGHGPGILIGDGLLSRAFEVLAIGADGITPGNISRSVIRLAHHSGVNGMVGGQALDIESGQDIRELGLLERVHSLKTGALYAAGGAMGAHRGGSIVVQRDRLVIIRGMAVPGTAAKEVREAAAPEAHRLPDRERSGKCHPRVQIRSATL